MTTNNELRTFDYAGLELRVIMHMAEPWFAAVDVCRALGMETSAGTSRWLAGLSKDEKARVTRRDYPQISCGRGAPSLNLLSESGLYKLIMRSDKPEARQFQDWVTREVLPSIRKTGGYLLNEEARETAKADDRQGMPLVALTVQGRFNLVL